MEGVAGTQFARRARLAGIESSQRYVQVAVGEVGDVDLARAQADDAQDLGLGDGAVGDEKIEPGAAAAHQEDAQQSDEQAAAAGTPPSGRGRR